MQPYSGWRRSVFLPAWAPGCPCQSADLRGSSTVSVLLGTPAALSPPGGELAGTPAALDSSAQQRFWGWGDGSASAECSDPVCRGLPVGPPGPPPVEEAAPGCRDAQPPGEEWLSSRFQLHCLVTGRGATPGPSSPPGCQATPLPRLHTHFTHTPRPPGPVLCPDCKAPAPQLDLSLT